MPHPPSKQGRNKPTSQVPSLAPSYADIVRTASPKTNVIQRPPPAERVEKLELSSSEKERRRKILRVRVTHRAILNSSPDLEAHVKQFFVQKLNMPRREIDDGMHVAKLAQPNTVLVKLSDHRCKIFLSQAKKHLCFCNDETDNDLFINESLTSLSYLLFGKVKSEKIRRNEMILANFEVVYTFLAKVFVNRVGAVGS